MSASGGDLVKTSDLEARLENAERQMELLLRSVPDAVVTIDESHVIQSFNVVAEEIFGYQASEVIGKPLEMLIPEQLRAKHQQHLDGFARDEATVRRMDGRL